ncbi:MAG: GNAT family N-acetyltransferase [Burkholderiales bacterium]|nr:GNAT family N-acetyltransferase [Burkholderiales bacterium]
MNYQVVLGDWAAMAADARPLREEVFIIEQQVPVELEWDEFDESSVHALFYDENGVALGTGRLLPDGHIGRMAVRKAARGNGIGSAILTALMNAARVRGNVEVVLNAQVHAESFYARFGFVREGDVFSDAGIPHIRMRHLFE